MKTEYCNVNFLNACLIGLVGSEALARDWWESPNKAFNGRMPYEVYLFDPDGQRIVGQYLAKFSMGECW